MRVVSKLVLAGFALAACSTTASAAVNFTSTALQLNAPAGYTTVLNFDGIQAAGYSYLGSTFSSTTSDAAEPAGDTSTFGAAEPGTDFVLTTPSLTSLSVYIGSLDSYNSISFYDGSTLVGSFTGSQLTVPVDEANGNQGSGLTNRRYDFTFGSDVDKVVFASNSPAFEFDNIAVAGVPEPATWAMMIIGFGFVGFMMRSNRQRTAVATV